MGLLESGMLFDFGQLMLDSEIMRMVSFIVRGVDINDETLALDEIRMVGDDEQDKDFMMTPLTVKYMRKLQSNPEFFNRQNRRAWEEAGAPTCYDKAVEKAKDVLEKHKPDPLPEKVAKDLREIIVETEKEWGAASCNPDFEVGKGYLVK